MKPSPPDDLRPLTEGWNDGFSSSATLFNFLFLVSHHKPFAWQRKRFDLLRRRGLGLRHDLFRGLGLDHLLLISSR